MTRLEADGIAEQTQDAYSFGAFGEKPWRASCRMLARRGYDAEGIEEIMRSKWTRWARDSGERYEGNSADLARFLDSGSDPITPENWKQHMAGEASD